MSELTVKSLQEMFPSMTSQEISRLLGVNYFTETTTVSAARVASYSGRFEQPLCVFYAKNVTDKFLPLLSESKQKSVMEAAGIDAKNVNGIRPEEPNHDNQPGGLLAMLKIIDFASPKSPLLDGINTNSRSAFGGDATVV